MSFDAGSIYYTIDAKTGALLTADKQVSDFNKRAQEGFERTSASMSKLTNIAKAISTALVSSQIISYAQSWNELEDRIENTGATASQTKEILDQLLTTSDRNGRTIEESAELYIRLSNSMKEMGYSTQGTLSYIDTLSNLMTINKTSAIGAESATNALTKAQMKGKLAGIEAMTVFNAMPSVLKTLGKQFNKTESEVRKMASEGKLSMSQFTEAMIAAQEETAALADNMRNTVTDGINRVTNNLKKYFGELNNSTGATKVLVDSLILMSQHVDILMTGVGALAAIYAGKYITSLANATKKSAEKVINDIKLAQAEKAAAQAALQQAQAEVAHLRAVQQSLAAQLKLAQTETTRNAIRKQLKANTEALTAATNQQTAAQARLDVAMKATSFAATGLRSAMALLGGPAGILLLSAGALMTWSSKAAEAKQKALDFSDSVDSLRDSLKSLTLNQLLDKQQDYCDNLENIENQIKNVVSEINNAEAKITAAKASFDMHPDTIKDAEREIIRLNSTLDTLIQKKSNASKIISYINTLLIDTSSGAEQATTGVDDFAKALEKVGTNKIEDKVKSLSTQLEIVQMKTSGAKKAAYIYENALNELGVAGEQYKATIRGLIEGSIEWASVSEDVRKALQPLFEMLSNLYDENEKLTASTKKGSSSTKSYADEVKELSDKLEIAKLEAKGMTVEAELLAITQKMGGKVTAEQTAKLKELIETTRAYNELGSLKSPIDVEKDSFKKSKELLDKLHELGEIKQAEYNSKLEQMEKQHQINIAKIKSEAAVSIVDDALAQVDPVQALANENARKLALIQEFENQKLLTEENAIALREAANHQFEQNRINAQWEIWRNQSEANELLAASLEGFASSASSTISGVLSDTGNASDAMKNLANVILNEVIGSFAQMGMQYVKNAITAQTASAATASAQTAEAVALAAAYKPAAMLASIASYGAAATTGATAFNAAMGMMSAMPIAGARKNGGLVDANSMYRVGEGGKPEILEAGGKQYLIPGENGRVLSNRQITSNQGQNIQWNFIVENHVSGVEVSKPSIDYENKIIRTAVTQAKREVANDIKEHTGEVWQAMSSTTNVQSKL